MRWLTVTSAIGFIIALLFGLMAAAYAISAALEDLGWLSNLVLLMVVFVMIIATLLTVAERKWSAMMQDRIGPNRARIALPGLKDRSLGGLPHVASDALKMLFKESFIPKNANRVLFNLGPVLAFAPVFALFAVVPAGPSVMVGGQRVDMVVSQPDFGLLYVFAIASLAVYGTSLAGWSSNNKLALLGGVRAASQMISYEVALGLSLVGMMVAMSTVQLPAMVAGQERYLWEATLDLGGSSLTLGVPAWGILLQPVGFVLFFAAAFAETKRAPFDVPEGESEIIGYFVEYSGMKFGMFMISEFVEIVILSAITTSIFFGGHAVPFVGAALARSDFFLSHPILWGAFSGTVFWVKVLMLCWLQLVIRWTFPRFRYDQIQALGWKMLLPAGLLNLFVSAALVLWDPSLRLLAVLGLLEIGAVMALTTTRRAPEADHPAEAAPADAAHAAPPH
ncbi:MAG TPA: complex I subunit 1 family protein [Myxococcaceae bacterium]|nr:complex I subunit 1 family protein [Myxococcaceae bacterium]